MARGGFYLFLPMAVTKKYHISASELLKAHDVRPTPQREIVLKSILEKRDHPTADEVFANVKAAMPGISLATVYNCLEAIVSCGLARSVNFERSPTRYCHNLHPHAHFCNEENGSTEDIDLPAKLLTKIKAILPAGYNASSVEIIFRGKAPTGANN